MTCALSAVVVVCALALSIATADATPRHHHNKTYSTSEFCGERYCGSAKEVRSTRYAYAGGTIIGGRPAGCPHRYCGCGARKYLGIDDVRLNLAWNWTKYYHGSTPVAVWRHHVAIIERMTGPTTAILRDYNSGRGLSRIHERSIAGARIVGRTNLAMQ